jgi:hypothetical protein
MIVTLTRTRVSTARCPSRDLQRGEVHRATASRIDPGGKGSEHLPCPDRAQGPHAGRSSSGWPRRGICWPSSWRRPASRSRSCRSAARSRANLALVEPDGTTTKINEPGPLLSGSELVALLAGATAMLPEQAELAGGFGQPSTRSGRRPVCRAGASLPRRRRPCRDRCVRPGAATRGRGGTRPDQAQPRRARRARRTFAGTPSATSSPQPSTSSPTGSPPRWSAWAATGLCWSRRR